MIRGFLAIARSRVLLSGRQGLLEFRRQLPEKLADSPSGFFDAYPRFYSTSITGAKPGRLNARHKVLIQSNQAIIRGKSVLDIASHDGRWSFAAHQAGARHVLGIEAREHLVRAAQSNMREYGLTEKQVEFVRGDIFVELDRLQPGTFETVFCFGFLYHTVHQMLLLAKIARLRPEHLILDTRVEVDPGCFIRLHSENVEDESSGAVFDAPEANYLVTGLPTRSALELMLTAAGFGSFSYYDWHRLGLRHWDKLDAYYLGRRISVVATGNWARAQAA